MQTPQKKAEAAHRSGELGAPMSILQIPVYTAVSYSVVPSLKVHFSPALKVNITLTLKPPPAPMQSKVGRLAHICCRAQINDQVSPEETILKVKQA